jgi:GNAT superfamily N-acetyltransferase
MNIRPAEENDIPYLMTLKNTDDYSIFQGRLKKMYRDEAAYLVCQDEKGRIVGQIFLDYYARDHFPQYPDILDLFVAPDMQGTGIGTALINVCEQICVQKGYAVVGITVNPALHSRARKLYERLGYFPTGEPPTLDGFIDMTKRLPVQL